MAPTTRDELINAAAGFHCESRGKWACGFGLRTFRHDHYEHSAKAAAAWCERENVALSKRLEGGR